MHKNRSAFTLIELLVVIAITAVLLAIGIPNYMSARERARDAKKKQELLQLANALRLYYNDYKTYPTAPSSGMNITGCGLDGATACPGTCSNIHFGAGGTTGCDTVYMKKLPDYSGTAFASLRYYQVNSGADFCLKWPLENRGDSDMATTQARCASLCTNMCMSTDYCVCSE